MVVASAPLMKEVPRLRAQVDATENAEAAEKYGVEGYPTLKFFVGGKATAYGGGRTEQEIVNWVRKKSGPAAVTLDTVDAAKAFTGGAEVAVVGLFASATSDAAKVSGGVASVFSVLRGVEFLRLRCRCSSAWLRKSTTLRSASRRPLMWLASTARRHRPSCC